MWWTTTRSPTHPRHVRPDDDLPARLVPADHVLVGLGALAEVLAVDRPQVAAADRRGLHGEDDLAPARLGVGHLAQVDPAAPGQVHASRLSSSRAPTGAAPLP
jgi:hypothetical protein